MADVTTHTEKIARLTALCCVCGAAMHRTIRRADIPEFLAAVEQESMALERLIGSSDPIENCDLEKAGADVEAQPAE